jgi:protein gp37
MTSALEPALAALLDHEDAIVAAQRDAWVETARHLKAIRDGELWKQRPGFEDKNFADYCRLFWDKTRTWGQQLIDALAITHMIESQNFDSDQGSAIAPANEGQALALVPLRDTPDLAATAWRRTVEQANGGAITARLVKESVKAVTTEASVHATARRNGTTARAIPRALPAGPFTVEAWNALDQDVRRRVLEHAPLDTKTFNRTNANVEWASWTWNPVTGCEHDCPYCYARDIAQRNQGGTFPLLFVPAFLPERLHAPRHMTPPPSAATQIGDQNVFVCSMADLFGKWVPQDWIDAVFEEVTAAPQWNFLFLTKFPQRLAEQAWPDNAWCGTTVDRQARVATAERSFRGVRAGVKWLSCEPLLERLTFTSLAMFDWVVIGASSKSTQTPEFQPPWEWVEHLITQARAAGCQIYLKPNLTSRPREYPGVLELPA